MKKGQFYFIAVLLLATIFIGLVTVKNLVSVTKTPAIYHSQTELDLEKEKILDYLAINDLNDADSQNILINFSKEYTNKTEKNKDILFAVVNKTTITFIGYKTENTNLSYDVGNGIENITSQNIEIKKSRQNDELKIYVDKNLYLFKLEKGQNIYYLIKHVYDKEVHIIYG